MCERVTKLLGV